MSRVNPVPQVVFIYTDGTEQVYAADLSASVATLDDLAVTWGRTSYTAHHDAQTARFSIVLHDPTYTTFSTFDWRGYRVQLRWSWTDPTTGPTTRTFFRGRVAEVAMRPRAPHPATGASRGAVFEFSCTGQLTQLGNRKTGTEQWPDESGQARLDRIVALAGTAVAGISMRSYWAGAPFAARRVDKTDALSLLHAQYDTSGGDRMTYDPHTNLVSWVARRAVAQMVAGARKRVALYADLEHGQGIAPRVVQPGVKYPMLDSREIESEGELSNSIESRITRVDYSWQEAGATATGTTYDPAAEADRGVTALSLSTELRQQNFAKQAGGDWLDSLWREGSKYRPPPMTYRADRFGGFPSLAHALLLIGATEQVGDGNQGSASMCYVAGTRWAPLGHAPTFGVIGGTIRYRRGGWLPTFYLQPTWHDDLTEQRPVRCSELTTLDGSTPYRFTWAELSPAVTWADLRHIAPR